MTQRKPPWATWEPWIEQQLSAAAEAGAFDNLPGAGKPLPDDLGDPYERFAKQLFEREQLSPVLPPSLELVRKVRNEIAGIGSLRDEAAVREHVAALNVEIARLNATVVDGPPTRLGLMDADEVVARWRRARTASVS